MYNRILRRPMFKRGGASHQAQGTGITSGLDTPRRGLVTHPGGYGGTGFEETITESETTNVLPGDMHNQGFMRGMSTMGAFDPNNPRTIGQMIYDASTAKNKYVDPIEAAKKERDLELQNARILREKEKEFLDTELASKEAIATMNAKDGNKTFMQLEVNKELGRLYDLGTQIDQKIQKELTEKGLKELPPDHPLMVEQRKNQMLLKDLQKKNSLISNMTEYQLDQAYKDAVKRAKKAEKELAKKEGREQKPIDKLEILRIMYEEIGQWEGASGGRVGLQNSYPGTVEDAQMSETIQTPNETVNVTENVQTAPSPEQATEQLSYEELRARLPKEITNDIVQLLSQSEEALLQFANIRTQQDVDSFNQTYDVQLILPQES